MTIKALKTYIHALSKTVSFTDAKSKTHWYQWFEGRDFLAIGEFENNSKEFYDELTEEVLRFLDTYKHYENCEDFQKDYIIIFAYAGSAKVTHEIELETMDEQGNYLRGEEQTLVGILHFILYDKRLDEFLMSYLQEDADAGWPSFETFSFLPDTHWKYAVRYFRDARFIKENPEYFREENIRKSRAFFKRMAQYYENGKVAEEKYEKRKT